MRSVLQELVKAMPNEVQVITLEETPEQGFGYLSYEGAEDVLGFTHLATGDDIESLLSAQPGIEPGDITAEITDSQKVITITFGGNLANTNVSQLVFTNNFSIYYEPIFAITNHVQGTAGTPQTFRITKPAAEINAGVWRLARQSTSPQINNLPWNITAAELQTAIVNAGQSYTVTDQGTYFQVTRTVNGSNGTWSVNPLYDSSNEIRRQIAGGIATTQEGGPDPVAGGRRRNRRRMTAG